MSNVRRCTAVQFLLHITEALGCVGVGVCARVCAQEVTKFQPGSNH